MTSKPTNRMSMEDVFSTPGHDRSLVAERFVLQGYGVCSIRMNTCRASAVAELMRKHDVNRLPVVENKDSRRVIGVIRSERMLRHLVAHMSD